MSISYRKYVGYATATAFAAAGTLLLENRGWEATHRRHLYEAGRAQSSNDTATATWLNDTISPFATAAIVAETNSPDRWALLGPRSNARIYTGDWYGHCNG